MKDKNLKKIAFFVWVGLFAIFFVLELYLESKQLVDNIGILYTIYVSIINSTVVLLLLMIGYFIVEKVFKIKPEDSR